MCHLTRCVLCLLLYCKNVYVVARLKRRVVHKNNLKPLLVTAVKIMKTKDKVKFKVRCSKYLYTLVVTDKEKADKLKQSLPPGT